MPFCTRWILNLTCAVLRQIVSFFVGRGPRVVVSTAAFHARVRVSVPGRGTSTRETQHCGEPP